MGARFADERKQLKGRASEGGRGSEEEELVAMALSSAEHRGPGCRQADTLTQSDRHLLASRDPSKVMWGIDREERVGDDNVLCGMIYRSLMRMFIMVSC